MVIRRLNSDWFDPQRGIVQTQPRDVEDAITSGYLQTVHKYKRTSENRNTEVLNLFSDMGDRMELGLMVNFAWARDVEPLFVEIRKQEEEREGCIGDHGCDSR
ncbi:hypothetical protein FRC03_008280 [Tulasnella sp. 419]|nr:hypothetical protein FRC03_008280 [Tulasnella sp. 419]